MTCREYLLREAKTHQLCVICSGGYIAETVWVDIKRNFKMSSELAKAKIVKIEAGTLPIDGPDGTIDVPCVYINT